MRYGAAVCGEGHVLSRYVQVGEKVDRFCSLCGSEVFPQCVHCGEKLRGVYEGFFGRDESPAPNFCHACGKAYPWAVRASERAKTAIDLHAATENVSPEDAASLKSFTDDLVSGTATEAEIHGMWAVVKKFGKAGPVLWDQMKDVGTTVTAKVMAEVVKAQMGL